jgi:ligand-binding sensor domain-containing protein
MPAACKTIYLIQVLFLAVVTNGFGQHIGIPFVKSYPKEYYSYGTQNWDIAQDSLGLLYFANNEGLLRFDGANWTIFPLENRTILRSLLIQPEGIYAGGQNEFGIYKADVSKDWVFHSLKDQIPRGYRDFDDVWEIEYHEGAIFFRSSERIYCFRKEGVSKVFYDQSFQFLGKAGGGLFAQGADGTLFTLQKEDWVVVPDNGILEGTTICDVSTAKEGIIFATLKNGLFQFDKGGLKLLQWASLRQLDNPSITAVQGLSNGDIALGPAWMVWW